MSGPVSGFLTNYDQRPRLAAAAGEDGDDLEPRRLEGEDQTAVHIALQCGRETTHARVTPSRESAPNCEARTVERNEDTTLEPKADVLGRKVFNPTSKRRGEAVLALEVRGLGVETGHTRGQTNVRTRL